jgi:hypothetical protein
MPGGQIGSGRTFTCAHCHCVVLVCSHCDRGQRYCSGRCRDQARRVAQRKAAGRYQDTPQGRLAHARRQQRYRQARAAKKVTHQGSQALGRGDVLEPELSVAQRVACEAPPAPPWHCHWCQRAVTNVVRRGFLRHATLLDSFPVWFGGITRGQSP